MVYEKIKQLCDEKGVSIYKAERDLGFSNASIVKWKNSNPAADKLKAVADYLGVSIDFLLNNSEDKAG